MSKSFSDSSLDLLSNTSFFEIKLGFDESDDQTAGLIVRSKDFITEDLLSKYPASKAIVSATSGFDHFNLSLLKTYPQVFFGYSPNANITSCSELTLMHALNLFKLQMSHHKQRSRVNFGSELQGKKALIIGLGRIGRVVAKLFQSFGVSVMATDPYVFKKDFGDLKIEPVSLKQGLEQADLVSLHCPITQKTKNIVDHSFLKTMKSTAFLINCARGELVAEADLLKSLKDNEIAGAALDVFNNEPLSEDSPLKSEPKILTSPHIGGFTHEAHKRSALEALTQVESILRDSKNTLTPLPTTLEWFNDLF